MSLPPSIYVRLVYYLQCRRKHWLIFFLVFLFILYIIHVIQRESYYDAIIIGSGRYPGILNSILEGEGKKTLLFLPSRMSGLTLHFQDNIHSWERLPLAQRYIAMQPLKEEEIETVSRVTGFPVERLEEANRDISEEGESFDTMSLPSSGVRVKRKEIECIQEGKVRDISGNTYFSPEIYLVETTSISLLERFINLDNPKEVTIQTEGGDRYIIPCSYNTETGLYEIQGGKDVCITDMVFHLENIPTTVLLLDSLLLKEQGLILYLLSRSKGVS